MITQIKNYIITYIDRYGEERVIDSNCYFNKTLEDKPLYKSLTNAKKGLTSIKNRLKEPRLISRLKHWAELAEADFKNLSGYEQHHIEDYYNTLYITEYNTLRIREVSIEINLKEIK